MSCTIDELRPGARLESASMQSRDVVTLRSRFDREGWHDAWLCSVTWWTQGHDGWHFLLAYDDVERMEVDLLANYDAIDDDRDEVKP